MLSPVEAWMPMPLRHLPRVPPRGSDLSCGVEGTRREAQMGRRRPAKSRWKTFKALRPGLPLPLHLQ